ncbi:MAG: hypothetical protein K1X89_19115 [Myxococcaceae bacterium]|nr:hypothetical protein [Myxococcaceae bacterium]
MGRFLVLALVMLSACLQPVDGAALVVSSCSGDCPLGPCGTCDRTDGGPDDALRVYSCLKSNLPLCTPYTAQAFQTSAPPPGASGGSYCFTTTEVPSRTIGVEAADAGAAAHDCTSPDAGAPCRTLCPKRKHYTVTGGSDGG